MIIEDTFGEIDFIIKNDLKNYLLKLKYKYKIIKMNIEYYKNKKEYITSVNLPFSYEYILNLKLNRSITLRCDQHFFINYIAECYHRVRLNLGNNLITMFLTELTR